MPTIELRSQRRMKQSTPSSSRTTLNVLDYASAMICHPVVRTGEERVRRSSKIECLRRLGTDTGSDPCPGTRYVHAERPHPCHARRPAASYPLDIRAFHDRDRRLALQYRHDRGGVTLRHRRKVRSTPGGRQLPTNSLTCRGLSGPDVRTCQMIIVSES